MIKVENIDVWGFEHAVRGMRNPLNSWDRRDSLFDKTGCYIGQNDLDLIKRLYKAGPEHRKFLRMIFVSMDITAPLYWWKEYDTYKVGTVANSCSTMHKIAAKEFSREDFSCDHLDDTSLSTLDMVISRLNLVRDIYNVDKRNKHAWWQMIQLLPSSYNQRRTVTMNYENVITMIKQRTGHKLDEWNEFVEILKGLPFIKDITEN